MDSRSGWLGVIIAASILACIVLYLIVSPSKSVKPIPPVRPEPTPTPRVEYIPPELAPTLIPTPAPTPIPSSIKQIGEILWRVHLTSKDWWDSGIPVVANQFTVIKGNSDESRWLSKVGEKIFFGRNGGWHENQTIRTLEDLGGREGIQVDYDFHDTLKLKLDDESRLEEVTLIIRFDKEDCPFRNNENHLALHTTYEQWQSQALEKIARK